MGNGEHWRRRESGEVVPLPVVLSLQSHVVRSCVGGPAFTFPLQRQGFQVGCIYTTQFVDMYQHEGTTLTPSALRTLLDGVSPTPSVLLRRRQEGNNWSARLAPTGGGAISGPDCREAPSEPCDGSKSEASSARALSGWSTRPHDYIVSGFIGNVALVSEFASWLRKLRQVYHECMESVPLYLCDPVLGDQGHVYVHPDCLPAYASVLLPLADIITPNHWEALWLVSQRQRNMPVTGQDPDSDGQNHYAKAISDQGSSSSKAGTGWHTLQADHSGGDVEAPVTLSEAIDLVNRLHSLGPEVVVITSIELADENSPQATEPSCQSGRSTPNSTPALPAWESSSLSHSSLFLVASRQKRASPRCTPSCYRSRMHRSDGSEPQSTASCTERSTVEDESDSCETLRQKQVPPGDGGWSRSTDGATRRETQGHTWDDSSGSLHKETFSQKGDKLSKVSSPPARCSCEAPSRGLAQSHKREENKIGSVVEDEEDDVVYFIRFPKQEATLCGSGDLWTALFLAAFHHCHYHLGNAIERALAGTQAVIQNTIRLHGVKSECVDVIGSCQDIDAAPVVYPATRLPRSAAAVSREAVDEK
ncbi:pyridoxal kinase [Cystoisospora suis]|uniref:pyridoxal kinase n=1 Tax=Cystoisospora suis TaxID=483139 RepID=A0A2C6KE33_9APIC|nr:pyridoxal kinase [Cystoisospora suis]